MRHWTAWQGAMLDLHGLLRIRRCWKAASDRRNEASIIRSRAGPSAFHWSTGNVLITVYGVRVRLATTKRRHTTTGLMIGVDDDRSVSCALRFHLGILMA